MAAANKGPIRLGMVGGGRDAFIGGVHRIAARLDGHYELVAGALSGNPKKARASGVDLGLDPDRCYGTYSEMVGGETARPDGIEAVAIVTPNHMHFPPAKAFLEAGIHVICDKPLTLTLAEAKKLAAVVEKTGKLFVLTHNYTGYPMIRQAREMVRKGQLGTLRLVQSEYPQDWLSEKLEASGHKQADWRTDPKRSGAGGCIGDIGTHAWNLATFVSGLETESLCADLDSFVKGRKLDDNANVMLRFKGGAKGMIWASQVAPGNENALKLRVYGTKGGLEWEQEHPNQLWFTPFGEPKRLITRGGAGSIDAAGRVTRVPPGHPEGYLEGFANIYSEAAAAIHAHRKKNGKIPKGVLFPTVTDGLDGMRFIDACVRSSKKNAAWIKL
ncbi:Gfo/Idh/MocA family protein [Denitrobaculum tricleocarpae]|uniref:Gfo/Idh/MocA family oxidoreductase n=1 Tax=Denitrobaculum tricleocarpae TaxID=2591009 RepID=A0A545TMN8_9PROT|nr:Gfo/Idh/MocA family oxidoreductase [Denitrobaculum tricleocarpae]TQV78456.1 Gfo/Idh/MocA family oxidoreductase [Denitrobaculum tricleocarpae]